MDSGVTQKLLPMVESCDKVQYCPRIKWLGAIIHLLEIVAECSADSVGNSPAVITVKTLQASSP